MSYPMCKNSRYDKPIIKNCWYKIYEKRSNFLVGITGSVGTGKSHTAVKIGSQFDKKFDINTALVYNVQDLLDASLSYIRVGGKQVTQEMITKIPNIKEWLKLNASKITISVGRVIIFDEAGTGAYVREFFSQDNKTLSKLIQIWRILRLLVIIVVPEDLRLADSTLIRFLNMEIKMLGINQDRDAAECLAWTYFGWDNRKKQPMRRRIDGCKRGGTIQIAPLSEELAEAYENISKVYKLDALMQMRMEYGLANNGKKVKAKTSWEYANYVKDNIEEFRDPSGKLRNIIIKTKLGVSRDKASEIRVNVDRLINAQPVTTT